MSILRIMHSNRLRGVIDLLDRITGKTIKSQRDVDDIMTVRNVDIDGDFEF